MVTHFHVEPKDDRKILCSDARFYRVFIESGPLNVHFQGWCECSVTPRKKQKKTICDSVASIFSALLIH